MDIPRLSPITNVKSIKVWNDFQTTVYDDSSVKDINTPFKIIPSLNSKVTIWCGNILQIRSQVIVIPINELLDSKLAVNTAAISKIGGSKYVEDFINLVLGCKTGEIRMTEGHDLPSQYVLHTVCPRYNAKYESAAINALYNCYRNALMISMEKGLRVITFAALHLSKYNFPDELAIHLAARTIRRFLEKYSEHIDLIVLHVPESLHSVYEDIMPIYFPRNNIEQIFSSENVPQDLGNEDGQPSQPNREIRISAFPYGPKTKSSDSEDESDSEKNNSTNNSGFCGITASAKHSLSQSHVAPALLRQNITSRGEGGLASTLRHYEQSVTLERKFERLLRASKKVNISAFTDKRVFYQCGKDLQERPLLLVVEKNIPRDVEMKKGEVLAFIIWTLEKVASSKEFIIIYAHTQSNFQPSRMFLQETVDLLNFRYYKYLRYLCMIHPTLINRGQNWLFSTFRAPELKQKMITITNLRQLYRIVNPSLLELPDFIYDYDRQVGGNNVYNDSVFLKSQLSVEHRENPENVSRGDAQL